MCRRVTVKMDSEMWKFQEIINFGARYEPVHFVICHLNRQKEWH